MTCEDLFHRFSYQDDWVKPWVQGLVDHDPVRNGVLSPTKRVRWYYTIGFVHHWNYVEFVKDAIQKRLVNHYEYIIRNLIPPVMRSLAVGIDDSVVTGTRALTKQDIGMLDMLLQNGFVITVGNSGYPRVVISDGDITIQHCDEMVVQVNDDLVTLLQGYKWYKGEYLRIAHPSKYLSQSSYVDLVLGYLGYTRIHQPQLSIVSTDTIPDMLTFTMEIIE